MGTISSIAKGRVTAAVDSAGAQLMSLTLDLPEQEVEDTILHEMIHYYIAEHQIKDNKAHGREFMRMAQELNEKYGLHITKTVDGSKIPLSPLAPKI